MTRIYEIHYERRPQANGWLCTIIFTATTDRQFTDETVSVECFRRWRWQSYWAARWEMKFWLQVNSAKPGEREAKGWTE